MKKLAVSFEKVHDSTGYLFSFAKCLYASLHNSPYAGLAEDAIAASGFAFRMWVDGEALCPSAMSIWEFKKQKTWVENAGLLCGYTERLWHEEAVEEERRSEAIRQIQRAIDAGVPPVVWDAGGAEWGLIAGYENGQLLAMKPDGQEYLLPCEKLGKLEIPILSVLTVTGQQPKPSAQLVSDTKKLAANHLRGREWCENASGLAAYDALTSFLEKHSEKECEWEAEYALGNIAALKWYAWKFFDKYNETALAETYQTICACWQEAFEQRNNRTKVISLLKEAQAAESRALALMEA